MSGLTSEHDNQYFLALLYRLAHLDISTMLLRVKKLFLITKTWQQAHISFIQEHPQQKGSVSPIRKLLQLIVLPIVHSSKRTQSEG